MSGKDSTEKRVAVVTGGSSGIGEAISTEVARLGYEVIIVYLNNDERAKHVLGEILKRGHSASIYKADVREEKDVINLFSLVKATHGKLDLLINNAGIYFPEQVTEHKAEVWDDILNTNLKAKFLCIKYAIPLLSNSSIPNIINISSRAGIKPMEESLAYCCAAAGINMLTKVCALELAKLKIRVNSISPGLTETPMTRRFDTDEDFANYANQNPSGRIGTAADVANLVSFLVSEKSSYINGENINVSGGVMLL